MSGGLTHATHCNVEPFSCPLFLPLLDVVLTMLDMSHLITLLYLQLGREVLDEGANAVGVGVTTEEIDRIVHEVEIIVVLVLLYFMFMSK